VVCVVALVACQGRDGDQSANDLLGGDSTGDETLNGFGGNDSTRPGSLLVFPLFLSGVTEHRISVVCPVEECPEGQRVKIRGHWVCPGDQRSICRETDFDLFTTVFGSLSFPAGPSALDHPGVASSRIPEPPCEKGYLILWVVDPFDRPIKFDGLIGDATFRGGGAAAAYNAIPIQAAASLNPGALTDSSENGRLDFGSEYQAVTGQIAGTVRFEEGDGNGETQTHLTLLTLNVLSNRPNLPTFVDLNFYNANEVLISTFTEFVCFMSTRLKEIDFNLTKLGMGTPHGLVVSGRAEKVAIGGIQDTPGPVTLLGIVTTVWTGDPATAVSHSLFGSGPPIPGAFAPNSVSPPAAD
jgi:hypothetical protein